jgi:hypothetical protein
MISSAVQGFGLPLAVEFQIRRSSLLPHCILSCKVEKLKVRLFSLDDSAVSGG